MDPFYETLCIYRMVTAYASVKHIIEFTLRPMYYTRHFKDDP